MRIRPYIEALDFESVAKWINTEEIHLYWCAGSMSYPLQKEEFGNFLEHNAAELTSSAYVATTEDGTQVGFFCLNIDVEKNEGFLRCIVVDSSQRGKGYGVKMLQLAQKYAFEIVGVDHVCLNVFDQNAPAIHCYEKAGLSPLSHEDGVKVAEDTYWSRTRMIAKRN